MDAVLHRQRELNARRASAYHRNSIVFLITHALNCFRKDAFPTRQKRIDRFYRACEFVGAKNCRCIWPRSDIQRKNVEMNFWPIGEANDFSFEVDILNRRSNEASLSKLRQRAKIDVHVITRYEAAERSGQGA